MRWALRRREGSGQSLSSRGRGTQAGGVGGYSHIWIRLPAPHSALRGVQPVVGLVHGEPGTFGDSQAGREGLE